MTKLVAVLIAVFALAANWSLIGSFVRRSTPLPGPFKRLALAVFDQLPWTARRHVASARLRAALGFERLEVAFSSAFPAPGHARIAAGLFSSAVALAGAGFIGVASVAPEPVVHLPHHVAAERASGLTLEGAAVEAPATPAAAPTTGAPPAAPTTTTTAPPPPPVAVVSPGPAGVLSTQRGGLPIGKGMWIWLHDRAEGGDANGIVQRAKAAGLTHLYVRTGTLKEGFMAAGFLDRLLPVAHASGIRVYGWDFPYMNDPGSDVNRALAAIRYTTPDGHRIDGFAPDIETKYEGTNENLEYVRAYVSWLRGNVGVDYPLIAVVPNPTPGRVTRGYPYADIVAPFDAIAPMVYWMDRDPGADVAQAITYLSQFGKPIFPIGQAYDGGIDGGPAGHPNRDALLRFLQVSDQLGATGVSFWSWQHASPEAWDTVRDAAEFRLDAGAPDALRPQMIRSYQLQLAFLGYPVGATGEWSPETGAAVTSFQRDHGLPQTGVVDEATRNTLLQPRASNLRMQ